MGGSIPLFDEVILLTAGLNQVLSFDAVSILPFTLVWPLWRDDVLMSGVKLRLPSSLFLTALFRML